MKGTAYCLGVGPGDPELMTLKAVRMIRENEIIMVPGTTAVDAVAYRIAVQAVPELAQKTLVAVDMPMTRDKEVLRRSHEKGAKLIESYLDQGKNVIYLTLGDSSIYCTFSYLQEILEKDGYSTGLVSGIPSFCAAAARLNIPLTEWNEPLHILPALHRVDEPLSLPGNYVLMKSGSHMKEVKELLRKSGRSVSAVENCGMETEKVYHQLEEIPDETGYFSLIIVKE
ncbi:MAG: precorrin-2 C(20)-methyltransferase [Blautia sp.]|nr:precorrin-2 C(20)-methyltransferase [Blautia sp.]